METDTTIWDRVRAASDHTGTTLEEHLEGTASVLADWGQRSIVVLAGRYHAVCGNPRGRGAICSLDSPELAGEIGDEATRLVHVWSQVERGSLARQVTAFRGDALRLVTPKGSHMLVTRQEFVDLAHLYAANEVEVLSRQHARCVRPEVAGLLPVLSPTAVACLERYRRPRRQGWWSKVRRRMRRVLSS